MVNAADTLRRHPDEPRDEAGGVLVIAEEPHAVRVVLGRLIREGFSARAVATPAEAMGFIDQGWPDLVVLQVGPANRDVTADLERLRAGRDIPVVMISPMGDAAERIWGLGLGADDFVPGPLIPDELVVRIRAVLRRARGPVAAAASITFVVGPLVLDEASRRVKVLGAWVTLTALEFALLAFLVRHPHQAFSREELLGRVWGYTFGDGSTVTVHVRRLREKIEADPARPMLIATVWGVGYRFDPTPAPGQPAGP